MTARTLICGAALALLGGHAVQAAACDAAPEPVFELAYGSRYTDESVTRADIDAKANAKVDEALGPVDDFIRDLARLANTVHAPEADRTAVADCVLAQVATWAEANALASLRTHTSNLTIGSRLAGFGLILDQVLPYARNDVQRAVVLDWLNGLVQRQLIFWEEDAPDGARQGNLRAWAALAANVTADLTGDDILRGWSAWSLRYILCKTAPDGSLPQEMSRGRLALHYQLHALAPLTVAAVRLERAGQSVMQDCDGALGRAVHFAVNDLETGAATQAITGEVQSYFDGTRTLKGFSLAWLEAYLTLDPDPELMRVADNFRPLNNSKLGGDQTLIWGHATDG